MPEKLNIPRIQANTVTVIDNSKLSGNKNI